MPIHWLRAATGLAVLGLATGCGTVNLAMDMNEYGEISESPDAASAYLVINVRFLPEDSPQPEWIALGQDYVVKHLSTARDIFEVAPTRARVTHLDFDEPPAKGFGESITLKRQKRNAPIVMLDAGVIYYYGVVEIDNTGDRTLVRTLFDTDLLRRACQEAPAVFEQFEVAPIGPVANDYHEFSECGELLAQPRRQQRNGVEVSAED